MSVRLPPRTLIRAVVVVAVLLFVVARRVDLAVSTAYESRWVAKGIGGCAECRLPTSWWIALHVLVDVVGLLLLLGGVLLWRLRRIEKAEALLTPEQRANRAQRTPGLLFVVLPAVAGAAIVASALFRWRADVGDGRGRLGAAAALDLGVLALIALLAVAVGKATAAPGRTGLDVAFDARRFFVRQRMNLIVLGGLVAAMLLFGETSGQAVDSIRTWTAAWDQHSLARLSFGIASTLLLALVVYEGGVRLVRAPAVGSDPPSVRARWWFAAAGALAVAGAILHWTLQLGWGLFVCAALAGALGLLELGRAAPRARKDVPEPEVNDAPSELVAIVPLVAIAAVALSAAVDAGLAGGVDLGWLRLLVPAGVLALLAVVMTSERPTEIERPPWGIFVFGAGLLLALTVALVALHVHEGPTYVVGFVLVLLGAGYAWLVFRHATVPFFGAVGRWGLTPWIGIGTGTVTFFVLHVDALGIGDTLGVFTLVNLSLAFVLGWLSLVVGWAVRRRPPRVLWWLGLDHLPIVTIVVLGWVLCGVILPPERLHDARLVAHAVPEAERPTLAQAFARWRDAQPDLGTAGPPVPLVLVGAHGGGIRAAYWSALALDCMVGVSARDAELRERDPSTCTTRRRSAAEQKAAARRVFLVSGVSGGNVGLFAYARELLAEGSLGDGAWVDDRLGRDFAAGTVGWGLFHDVPNHVLGIHPDAGGKCAWHFFGSCATVDRAAVLEDAFDEAWEGESPLLRATWEARSSDDETTRARAESVPLWIGNSTVTGGRTRAVTSAANLSAWPFLEGEDVVLGEASGPDPRPLAGTAEISDSLCASHDLRLSTAANLAARFPFVAPSGRLEQRCASGDGEVAPADEQSACALVRRESVCEIGVVDGGYTDNSGLFTIAALWPSLRALVVEYNRIAGNARKIAPVIVELDNHYRPLAREVPSGSGVSSETLIPPVTALGGRAAIETFARAVAYRLTPAGCTITISPGLHPGLVAPLGWELSSEAREDLKRGLVEPRSTATRPEDRLEPVRLLRRLQAWLGDEDVPGGGPELTACLPPD